MSGDGLERLLEAANALVHFNSDVAAAAHPKVRAAIGKLADQQVAPDGKAWPEKQGGGRALAGASADLDSESVGTTVKVRIGAPYVFHNWGSGGSSTTENAERKRREAKRTRENDAKEGNARTNKFHAPRRQILPTAGETLPKPVAEAIEAAATTTFERTMKGEL